MPNDLRDLKQGFIESLADISRFWGFPKGVGAIFAVLYLSPGSLSLDQLVSQSGLTKGAISTDVRALARLGLVQRMTRLGDRKDYYVAETDFYKAIRSILGERRNREFDRAIRSVRETLDQLKALKSSRTDAERAFLIERIQALQDFFDALDSLARAMAKFDTLGLSTVQKILSIMK